LQVHDPEMRSKEELSRINVSTTMMIQQEAMTASSAGPIAFIPVIDENQGGYFRN
jgi:hypothetical protein